MKPAVSLSGRQRAAAADTITDFQIEKTEAGIQIRFRAFKAFVPSSLDGRRASIYLNEKLEDCKEAKGDLVISGDIRVIGPTVPRGTWFAYEFRPISGTIDDIRFEGEGNQWSNITSVIIDLGIEALLLKNDFTIWRRAAQKA